MDWIYAFLLVEILSFQDKVHLIGVGSLSMWLTILFILDIISQCNEVGKKDMHILSKFVDENV